MTCRAPPKGRSRQSKSARLETRGGGETTMQEISTNVLLAFALVALAVIIVTVFLIRRLMGIGNTEQAFVAPAPVVTAQPPPSQPQPAQAQPSYLQSSHSEPSCPAASQAPSSQTRARSYTEISEAEAPYAPARPIVQAKVIDYFNETADAGPSASYTAIVIADAARRARGGAPAAQAPSIQAPSASAPAAAGNVNGAAAPVRPAPSSSSSASDQSYTSLALAAVGQPRPKTDEPPRAPRIDYSGMPADIGSNASYTAIAVAAAARAAGP